MEIQTILPIRVLFADGSEYVFDGDEGLFPSPEDELDCWCRTFGWHRIPTGLCDDETGELATFI